MKKVIFEQTAGGWEVQLILDGGPLAKRSFQNTGLALAQTYVNEFLVYPLNDWKRLNNIK